MPPVPQKRQSPCFDAAIALAAGMLYVCVRAAFWPKTFNTHAIMYALVVERGSNTLELFHPLWVPVLSAVRFLWRAAGADGPALPAYQMLCLAGAAVHLALIYAIAKRATASWRLALGAAALGAASVNLWAWSLQTMPYTWATALMLAAVFHALAPAPNAALLGILTGLAAGFDTAAIALIPPLIFELRGRGRAIYAATAAAAIFLAYLPFVAWGRKLPSSFGSMLGGLPQDIETLWRSRSLPHQLLAWKQSTAPVDAPWLMAALLLGWLVWRRRGEDKLARLGAGLFAGVSFFFFCNDPHNRFIYAAGLLAAPALASARIAPIYLYALAVPLAAKNLLWPPDYLPPSNPAWAEANFVASRLGPRDLLVPVSEPDWIFSYALAGRVPVAINAAADDIARTVCARRQAWLASDTLFRGAAPATEMVNRYTEELSRSFTLGEPIISPLGQYYYPLSCRASMRH